MITLIADPSVAAIPVHENGEPLVDLATLGIACRRPPATSHLGRHVRVGVADRLVAADAALPVGLRLMITEGARSAQAQRRLFGSSVERVRSASRHLTEPQIRREASRFVAPIEVAGHVAGAAVDLTVVDLDGRRFELTVPPGSSAEVSRLACPFDSEVISDRARENRAMLASVLSGAGMISYPTEWWHWSFGDRYWAFLTGAPAATYGPVDQGELT